MSCRTNRLSANGTWASFKKRIRHHGPSPTTMLYVNVKFLFWGDIFGFSLKLKGLVFDESCLLWSCIYYFFLSA